MNTNNLPAAVIFTAFGVACAASAAATGLVLRKLQPKEPKYRYPSEQDSELYKF
jgi:hypothetical protein